LVGGITALQGAVTSTGTRHTKNRSTTITELHMQQFDITTEEFSIEALEARFEMETAPVDSDLDWKCTCTIEA
jgi:hypothetical protein